ncbi:MAG: sugar kinase [Betaproteobacteria bacterium RIFCSPLOWO2_02_FULL_65_24]|nr:MAG: sugar kinase [Betaproteobacteria bacterium RIFCSPLOWO2_02_FULL_65_24]OGA95486.1 MAG: sugar kinase [Betaproteobacteria bacterium RIFCSPLOWO2_12_FULL_66_14]
MRTLICGSMAYDNIMVFHGRFKDQILPEQIHILNVAFLVPQLRREFGGCAGNIAYNLKHLGGQPAVMATVGEDSAPYFHRLERLGLERTYVREVPDTLTAQAFITTDLDDNQITAFHPGAMNHSHLNKIGDTQGVTLAIVAPDGREGMLEHARALAEARIPFMFDPGQGLPMFDGGDLLNLVEQASYVAVNDYEGKMLEERTGVSLQVIAKEVEALIVTRGAEGSTIFAEGERIDVPAAKPEAIVDPTGCGDAYRAGLLYGIASGMDWRSTGQLASVMGALKIASRGGQNHEVTRDRVALLYRKTFGPSPW